ncbi:MAG: hypothetical protein JRJ87_25795 [Deltaproteobacteria bacterium]|nr:hypothetical protein [Deltaproteobacteria bacterium]
MRFEILKSALLVLLLGLSGFLATNCSSSHTPEEDGQDGGDADAGSAEDAGDLQIAVHRIPPKKTDRTAAMPMPVQLKMPEILVMTAVFSRPMTAVFIRPTTAVFIRPMTVVFSRPMMAVWQATTAA